MPACGARKLRWAAEVECEVEDERPGWQSCWMGLWRRMAVLLRATIS